MVSLLPRSQKLRTALAVVASLMFVGVVATILVMSAGSGDKDNAGKPKTKKPSASAPAKRPSLKLVMGPVIVQNTGLPTTVRPGVRRSVMGATQRYFDRAIQAPLRRGRVDNAYSKMFDAGVKGVAARKDRAVLTEAATGPIRGPVRMSASRVRIDALGDPTGKPALVATTFTLKVNTAAPTGKLTIRRRTELTFAYESNRWVVTAYRVTVRRTIGPKTTSTTAQASPGKSA